MEKLIFSTVSIFKKAINCLFKFLGYKIHKINKQRADRHNWHLGVNGCCFKDSNRFHTANNLKIIAGKMENIHYIKSQLIKDDYNLDDLLQKAKALQDLYFEPKIPHILHNLSRSLVGRGRTNDAISLFNNYALLNPDVPFFSNKNAREYSRDLLSAQCLNIPTIFLASMRQCGTAFMLNSIQGGLLLPRCRFTPSGAGLDDFILPAWAKQSRNGGCVVIEHIPPSQSNMKLITENNLNKIVLLVRDIRQSALSNAYHQKFNLNKDTGGYVNNNPASIEEILKEKFVTLITIRTQWLKGWLDLKERERETGIKILLTHFQDMKENTENFIKEILDFYEVPYFKFDFSKIPKPEKGKAHYRSGRLNEWREVLNEDQKAKAIEIMGTDLINKMGWAVH